MPDASGRPRRKRLSWESRCEIVAKVRLQGISPHQAAASSGVHRSTVYRLLGRFDHGGWAGLIDRRPVPHRQPRRLPHELEERILAARAASAYGPARLGAILGIPASTVAKVLARAGCSRLPKAPRPAVARYERARPGELLHVDTKRLGRFHAVGKRILGDGIRRSPRAGWQHLHVAVNDHSRIAYCELLAGQGAEHSCAFLERAVAWFASEHGIAIERVLSDNGHADRSRAWRGGVRAPRDRASAHPAIHAAHQRQGRGADRHDAARVGLAVCLPDKRPPRPRPAWLGALVQPTSPPQLSGQPAADQPCRAGPWSVRLGLPVCAAASRDMAAPPRPRLREGGGAERARRCTPFRTQDGGPDRLSALQPHPQRRAERHPVGQAPTRGRGTARSTGSRQTGC